MKLGVYVMVFLISSTFSVSLASEISFECPKEIQTEQNAVEARLPKGWTAKRDFNFESQVLENLSVYDGVPEEGARLKPNAKNVWIFSKEKVRSIWLGCEYQGTKMLLAKELPKDITKCRFLFKNKESKSYSGVVCK